MFYIAENITAQYLRQEYRAALQIILYQKGNLVKPLTIKL